MIKEALEKLRLNSGQNYKEGINKEVDIRNQSENKNDKDGQ